MMIIGCDFSSQLAASELVGYGDRRNWRAEAGPGLRRRGTVLPASSGAGADRHGSHRQLSLVGGFAERVGSRAVGGRCGADSCQLRAAAPPSGEAYASSLNPQGLKSAERLKMAQRP